MAKIGLKMAKYALESIKFDLSDFNTRTVKSDFYFPE
jgi:hypothetical protein